MCIRDRSRMLHWKQRGHVLTRGQFLMFVLSMGRPGPGRQGGIEAYLLVPGHALSSRPLSCPCEQKLLPAASPTARSRLTSQHRMDSTHDQPERSTDQHSSTGQSAQHDQHYTIEHTTVRAARLAQCARRPCMAALAAFSPLSVFILSTSIK
eukprot:TRINITY_DN21014_c0_g1_i3.p1 TRINITY_DN21014_c0_g1~~TRINITY_DN21014_c0_g1_i3.p1  ORF type:complete len:152 (+),score=10.21 TRINITY_DN21014_c0_g1_i3:167-622(+)